MQNKYTRPDWFAPPLSESAIVEVKEMKEPDPISIWEKTIENVDYIRQNRYVFIKDKGTGSERFLKEGVEQKGSERILIYEFAFQAVCAKPFNRPTAERWLRLVRKEKPEENWNIEVYEKGERYDYANGVQADKPIAERNSEPYIPKKSKRDLEEEEMIERQQRWKEEARYRERKEAEQYWKLRDCYPNE